METPSAATCHCGRTVEPRDPDPWEGRMDDYCYDCATNRCDCYPDKCPVKYPPERSAASLRYPTDTVMCSACSGTGEYDWGEIDVFSRCATCDGVGEIEVCAQCHDSGEECDACGC